VPASNEDHAPTTILEAYGARLAVSAPDAATLRAIVSGLPRGWEQSQAAVEPKDVKWRFGIHRASEGYLIRDDQGREHPCAELDLAIVMLHSQMRRFVGYHTDELIFVHAGVVAADGAAVVLPGHSFAGKSTLVEALVRAGAQFYSDEYAMFDAQGRVAHYREPLSRRGAHGQEEVELGSGEPLEPVTVGLVAFTSYRPGARWEPRRLSIGEALVAMMEHAVPARERPAETLAALSQALAGAKLLSGERGEADETAGALIAALRAA
jgi:hypothetical protein